MREREAMRVERLPRKGDRRPAVVRRHIALLADERMPVQAGLYLPLNSSDFFAGSGSLANPTAHGNLSKLNRVGLENEDCFQSCSFNRTVADNSEGGTWQISSTATAGARSVARAPSIPTGKVGLRPRWTASGRRPSRLGRHAAGSMPPGPMFVPFSRSIACSLPSLR